MYSYNVQITAELDAGRIIDFHNALKWSSQISHDIALKEHKTKMK